jgi:hypothetical protein
VAPTPRREPPQRPQDATPFGATDDVPAFLLRGRRAVG